MDITQSYEQTCKLCLTMLYYTHCFNLECLFARIFTERFYEGFVDKREICTIVEHHLHVWYEGLVNSFHVSTFACHNKNSCAH